MKQLMQIAALLVLVTANVIAAPQDRVFHDAKFAQMDASSVVALLNERAEAGGLDLENYADLATALMLVGQPLAARFALAGAFSQAKTDGERAAIYMAQALAFQQASVRPETSDADRSLLLADGYRLAQAGLRLAPKSQSLASIRYYFALEMGDDLLATAAREYLMVINVSGAGTEVMDPVTGAVIIVGIVSGAFLAAFAMEDDAGVRESLVAGYFAFAELRRLL